MAPPAVSTPALALIGAGGEIEQSTETFRLHYEDKAEFCRHSPQIESVLAGNADRAVVSLEGRDAQVEAVVDAAGTRHVLLTLALDPSDAPGEAANTVLAEALEESPAIAWLKDLDGRYLQVNRTYATLLGVAADRIVGRTDAELEPRETVDGPRIQERGESPDEPLQFEYTVPAFEKRPTMAVLRFPIRDHDANPIGVCGVAAPFDQARVARDEAARLIEIERLSRLDPTAVRAELLSEWGMLADGADVVPLRSEAPGASVEAVAEHGRASLEAAQRTQALEAELAMERARSEDLERTLEQARRQLEEMLRAPTGDDAEEQRRQAELARTEVAEARAEAQEARAEAESARSDAELAARRVAQLERDVPQLRARAERAEDEALEWRAHAERGDAQVEQVRARAERLQAEAEQARADAQRADARAEQARADAEAERARAVAALDQARTQAGRAEVQVREAQEPLSEQVEASLAQALARAERAEAEAEGVRARARLAEEEAQAEVKQARARAEEAETAARQERTRADEAERQVRQALARAEDAEAQVKQARERAEEAESQARRARARAEETEASGRQARTRADEAEAALRQAVVRAEEAAAEVVRAESELERARAQGDSEVQRARAHAEQSEAETKRLRGLLDEAEAAAEHARMEAEQAASELERARGRAETAESDSRDAQARAEKAVSEATQSGARAQAQEELLAAAIAERDAAVAKNTQLERELEAARRQSAASAIAADRVRELVLALSNERELTSALTVGRERTDALMRALAADDAAEVNDSDPAPSVRLRWAPEAERMLLAALSGAASWEAGLGQAVAILGSEGGWDAVRAWIPDERETLTCAADWTRDPRFAGLDAEPAPGKDGGSLLDQALVAPAGTWVTDIEATDDARLAAAARHGMRSALLLPVRAGVATIGLLELLSATRAEPDPRITMSLEASALQVGRFAARLG